MYDCFQNTAVTTVKFVQYLEILPRSLTSMKINGCARPVSIIIYRKASKLC